jgi:hypothetical protein
MSLSQTQIFLVDGRTNELCEAVLCEGIQDKHLNDFENTWRPWLDKAFVQNPMLPRQESRHWDWRKKVGYIKGLLAYPTFAIECIGQTQGLMIVDTTTHQCRLIGQSKKPLVYVEYIETAPWNRSSLTNPPKFRGVGSIMISVAIQLSKNEGYDGRIGLHSLPQSEIWYSQKCKMVDLGKDAQKLNLRYFEMTSEHSNLFLKEQS